LYEETEGASKENCTACSDAYLEQDTRCGDISEDGDKEDDTRYDILVKSYRKRKHDPDGISIKAVLDGCVREKILQDDSWDEIRQITFRSIRCKKDQGEETVIEFYRSIDKNVKE